MNKITLLLILVTQFSFAQSMSQFTVSDVYENHTLCGSPGASPYNNYDSETNILTIQTDNATLTNLKFAAQIRFSNSTGGGIKVTGSDLTKSDIFTSNTNEFIIDGFIGGQLQDAYKTDCNDVEKGKKNFGFFSIDFSNNNTWNSKSGYTEIELANAVNIIPTSSIFSGNGDYPQNIQMTVKVIYNPALSTNDLKQLYNFSFAPNPTQNQLNLKANKLISNVELFNTLGQKALSKNINALNTNIDLTHLKKGIYIMKATIGDKTGAFRIIKN